MGNSLTLKWGTLKAWDLTGNEKAITALNRYNEQPTSMSAMSQRDTPEQKQAICDIIDALDCETVTNDWDGAEMTKEEAKKYVMEYGTK